jgi:hypothetical protein
VGGADFKSTTRDVATISTRPPPPTRVAPRLNRHRRGWNCSVSTNWATLPDRDTLGRSQVEVLSVRQPTGLKSAVGRVGGALPSTRVASRLERRHRRDWGCCASTNWEALLDRDVSEVDQW